MNEHETQSPAPDHPTPEPPPPQERQRYSRKARILAWIGVAFMVFLVIMYTYSLASGKIMEI